MTIDVLNLSLLRAARNICWYLRANMPIAKNWKYFSRFIQHNTVPIMGHKTKRAKCVMPILSEMLLISVS